MIKHLLAAVIVMHGAVHVLAAQIDLRDPRSEAEYLALEIAGTLRPDAGLADQTQADLTAIRPLFPIVANIHVLPSWAPGDVLMKLTPTAYEEYRTNTFHGFDSLLNSLGTPDAVLSSSSLFRSLYLSFGQMYHGVRLAELFRGISGVEYAEPNGLIGDGDDVIVGTDRTYTLSHGFGDCPAGCIYRQSWKFGVSSIGVMLLNGSIPEPSTAMYTACMLTAVIAKWRFSRTRRRLSSTSTLGSRT